MASLRQLFRGVAKDISACARDFMDVSTGRALLEAIAGRDHRHDRETGDVFDAKGRFVYNDEAQQTFFKLSLTGSLQIAATFVKVALPLMAPASALAWGLALFWGLPALAGNAGAALKGLGYQGRQAGDDDACRQKPSTIPAEPVAAPV